MTKDMTNGIVASNSMELSERDKELSDRVVKEVYMIEDITIDSYPLPKTPSFVAGFGVLAKLLHPSAKVPVKARRGDSGFDISSVENLVLLPGKFTAIATGLSFAMGENIELQIRPRSGLAAKHGVTVLNSPGTIDSGYRGEVKVLLINHGDKPFEIKVGDRIAQGVFAFLPTIVLEEVAELPTSERGDGGFGSTGK